MADYTKVIPPGQEGTIKVSMGGKKIFPGHTEATLRVKTNDPANADFMLTLQFNIQRVLDISNQLNWAGFPDENLALETIITNMMTTPIHITGFEWSKSAKMRQLDQKLAVKLETIQKGKKYRLTVVKKKGLPSDRYYGEITLLTDYPKVPTKVLAFNINVMSDVALFPRHVFLGDMLIEKGKSKSFDKVFNIVAERGDTLKILKVVPSSADISVKVAEQTPGKSFMGTVSVRPPDKLGQYSGSVKIFTNYRQCKELTLGVVGNVRHGAPSEPKK